VTACKPRPMVALNYQRCVCLLCVMASMTCNLTNGLAYRAAGCICI